MTRKSYSFEQFIRQVHRRHLLVRLLERAALGGLCGCAVALPLLGIAIWRGLSGLPLAIAVLTLGILAGMLWGIITRPSTFDAAMEADRQLGWSDLMSSALAIRSHSQDDPWARTLIAIADAQCRDVLPSNVVFNRFGARAWGGIGLATALVVVLGLLPTYAISTQEGDHQASSENRVGETERPDLPRQELAQSTARRTPAQEDPDDPHASRINGAQPPRQAVGPLDSSVRDQNESNAADSGGNGRAGGASRSDSPPVHSTNLAQFATHSRNGSGAGNQSGGVGESARRPGDGAEQSGQTAGSSHDRLSQLPPWQSPDWAAHSREAVDAVNDGRIPDAYCDVVRGYFERP